MSTRVGRSVAIVTAVVALLVGVAVQDAGARYRPPKGDGLFNSLFFPIRICTDGVEFALGREYRPVSPDEPPPPTTPVVEAVTLYRGTYTEVAMHAVASVPYVANPAAVVPGWDGVKPYVWLSVLKSRWTGNRVFPVGESLIGLLYETPAINEPPLFPVTFDAGSVHEFPSTFRQEPPLVVQSCSLFGPVPISVDVWPGVTPNVIVPGLKVPVLFAVHSKPGFDASTINRATLRVGTAPTLSVVVDVDRDGDRDVLGLFLPSQSGIRCGDRTVVITGKTTNGQSVAGSDSIRTLLCRP